MERIARNESGDIDDLTARDVSLVRLERLNVDSFWLQIDDRRIHLTARDAELDITDMNDRDPGL